MLFGSCAQIEQWLAVQNMWTYMKAVFSSGDIVKQLPAEAKRFQNIDKSFMKVSGKFSVQVHCQVYTVCIFAGIASAASIRVQQTGTVSLYKPSSHLGMLSATLSFQVAPEEPPD